jgi:hypothetical protein
VSPSGSQLFFASVLRKDIPGEAARRIIVSFVLQEIKFSFVLKSFNIKEPGRQRTRYTARHHHGSAGSQRTG